MGKARNQGSLEHGKEICSSFKSNEVIKIRSNRKSRNKSEKFSKKESSKIQDVTRSSPAVTTQSGGARCGRRLRARQTTPRVPKRSPYTFTSRGAHALTGGGRRPRRGGASAVAGVLLRRESVMGAWGGAWSRGFAAHAHRG